MELASGLNCFTGATGAGKSLVIGAVEVLLGQRSASEMLRPGVDEGRVSGVFHVADASLLKAIEAASDVPVANDGGELLINRRLYASGRSSVSLNGHPITLSMLKIVAEHLIDVHGQHDHQFLLKPSNQLDVLDQFGKLSALRESYREAFTAWTEAKHRLAELAANRSLRQQQLELYRFQANEIDAAELQPGEYEELSARASVLRNIERLKRDASATHSALYETDGSVLERVKMMAAVIAELTLVDPSLQTVAAGLKDAMIQLEESSFDLSRYLDRLDLDPAELAEVDDRLNTLQRLMNKYGDTPAGVLAHREEIGRLIMTLEKAGDDLSSIESQLTPLQTKAAELAKSLGEKRRAIAKKLTPAIEQSLAELGMEKAKFTVELSPIDLSPSGGDAVEFLVQTNPGQATHPLRKIASGGELSRIMLALKGILAQSDRVSVLVFDEIDANVGGRLGSIHRQQTPRGWPRTTRCCASRTSRKSLRMPTGTSPYEKSSRVRAHKPPCDPPKGLNASKNSQK